MLNKIEGDENMKMAFTQKQRMIEGLTIFTLMAISIYVAVMWGKIPQEVATSFGITGKVGGMGSKASILWKLAISYGIYLVFTMIYLNPSLWGIGNIKNKKKQEQAFLLAGDLFVFLKLILVSIMAYIIFCIINNVDLGFVFIPMSAFLPLAIGFNTSAKIKELKN